MKRNRLFLKYFIVNLGLVMMILIGVLADAAYTYRLQKSSVISQNENRMELGVGELETTIKSMYTMSSTLRSNESLGMLSRYQGETLTADKFVFLNYLKNELLNLKLIADLPATGFILFRDNDVYVSNAQTAEKFEDYYGTFFEVSGKSKEEFKEEIMDCTAPVTCKTYDSITIYDSGMKKLEHPLLVVVTMQITGWNLPRLYLLFRETNSTGSYIWTARIIWHVSVTVQEIFYVLTGPGRKNWRSTGIRMVPGRRCPVRSTEHPGTCCAVQ